MNSVKIFLMNNQNGGIHFVFLRQTFRDQVHLKRLMRKITRKLPSTWMRSQRTITGNVKLRNKSCKSRGKDSRKVLKRVGYDFHMTFY